MMRSAIFVVIRVCPLPENGVPFLISTINMLEGNGANLRTVSGCYYCPPTGGRLEIFAEGA